MKPTQKTVSPLVDVADAVDTAIFDPNPLARSEARAYLRTFDMETVLVAARGPLRARRANVSPAAG